MERLFFYNSKESFIKLINSLNNIGSITLNEKLSLERFFTENVELSLSKGLKPKDFKMRNLIFVYQNNEHKPNEFELSKSLYYFLIILVIFCIITLLIVVFFTPLNSFFLDNSPLGAYFSYWNFYIS